MTAKQKAAREKFKKVVAEAGKLRKKNPKLTQAQAVKQAFAMQKKVSAVKKKSAPKKKAAKKIGYKSDRTEILSKATPFIKMYQNRGDSRKEAIKKANKFASTLNGVKKKFTNKQLEKIASDYAYVTGGDLDKLTYRLLDKDYTEKLLPVYLKSISDFEKKYDMKISGIKKKSAPKKKDAPKKVASKRITDIHKDSKSHNVNIKVVSGVEYTKSEYLQEIEDVKNEILKQTRDLEKLQKSYKETKDKVKKEYLKNDIGVLKYNFIPHNKRYLISLKSTLKKSI
jgi:hypothetical protein